jgi:hypothetical protein
MYTTLLMDKAQDQYYIWLKPTYKQQIKINR